MVVIVIALILLGFVLVCEGIDWIRGAAVGGLWVFLALAGIAAAVVVPQLQS